VRTCSLLRAISIRRGLPVTGPTARPPRWLAISVIYQPWRFCGQANVARILFVRSLARRFRSFGITANSLHPGVIAATSLSRNLGWALRAIAPVATVHEVVSTRCSDAQDDATGERL